jgi:ribosomal protein S18 acetylase RimI-like enzyme
VSKNVTAPQIAVRTMREADLDAVLKITNDAFRGLVQSNTGRRPEGPLFASSLGRYRLEVDPRGCHVALSGDEVVGANFSVLRGTLGWFGPLAVRPDVQGHGIAQRLVMECLRSAEERGVRLMGLETLANSAQHVHLYLKLGFRPSWTGISFRGEVRDGQIPRDVDVDGAIPKLGYLYPGYDATNDARAARAAKVGVTLTYGDGLAICHYINTLWTDTSIVYVPLVVAPDRKIFDALVRAVEAVAREHGKTHVVTQVPGSSWATQEALLEHGYETGGAALRMKRGENLDYDAGSIYYCDDWH